MRNSRLMVILGLVAAAALLRVFPHPPNFAPIAAMALFAGAHLDDRRLAFAAPLFAMLLSDVVLGFHDSMLLVYVCMCISVAIGMGLRTRLRTATVAAGTLASSVVFFVVTNFGVWLAGGLYPLTLAGLSACYVAAIPFFHHTLLGDGFYVLVLFGGFAAVERWRPELRTPLTRPS